MISNMLGKELLLANLQYSCELCKERKREIAAPSPNPSPIGRGVKCEIPL